MTADQRLVAFTWHQRTSPIDVRERLLTSLAPARDRARLATCHRVELYAVLPEGGSVGEFVDGLALAPPDALSMTTHVGRDALSHLFAVGAGLDSAVAGEPQILSQVRRAYTSQHGLHPLLVAAFERAIHVGRTVRTEAGLSSARSVGSLAVDIVVEQLASPADATVLVIGAGEMGKLAVRALTRRVGRVVVANRDIQRATVLAEVHDALAVPLTDVPRALTEADAVVSAADTRGTLLTASLVAERLRAGRSLVIVDVAVPRSLDADARAIAGERYRSVDDLPGASTRVPETTLRRALERCAAEAARFSNERAPDGKEAIRAMRESAERVRAEKLERALQRLGHLSDRDRRVVEVLSTRLVNALLHEPTVALRERRADPSAARSLFEKTMR